MVRVLIEIEVPADAAAGLAGPLLVVSGPLAERAARSLRKLGVPAALLHASAPNDVALHAEGASPEPLTNAWRAIGAMRVRSHDPAIVRPAPARFDLPSARLRALEGAEQDASWPLPAGPGTSFAIGRSRWGCDLWIKEKAVSRHHAVIYPDPRGYVIADVGSSGGTFVNNVRLSAPRTLAHGDVVSIGPWKLEFISDAKVQQPAQFDPRAAARDEALADSFNVEQTMMTLAEPERPPET